MLSRIYIYMYIHHKMYVCTYIHTYVHTYIHTLCICILKLNPHLDQDKTEVNYAPPEAEDGVLEAGVYSHIDLKNTN